MYTRDGSSDNEAVKIANALKPFVKKWFDEWGRSCVREKKMTVTTAPNSSTGLIGVTDAFSNTELFIKYMSSCANAAVGDTVWVKWMYDNMQTLYADSMGNLNSEIVHHYDDTVGSDITIGSSNYKQMTVPQAISGKNIISITLLYWNSNSGAFSVIPYNTNTYFYVVGNSGTTITGAKFRYWYVD